MPNENLNSRGCTVQQAGETGQQTEEKDVHCTATWGMMYCGEERLYIRAGDAG